MNSTGMSSPSEDVPTVFSAGGLRTRDSDPPGFGLDPDRQLAALIPVGVFMCDAEGRLTFFNRRAVELWGREPALNDEEQRYCGCLRAWQIDGSPMFTHELPVAKALMRKHRFRDQEFIIERPDGTRLACAVTVEPRFDEAGSLAGAIAMFQDITERKRTEELLSRQADLLAQTHDAIFAWQWDGTIVFWNRGAERLYGFSTTEALGKKTFELLSGRSPAEFADLRARLSREGQITKELEQLARDGRRLVVESRLVLSRSFDAQPVVLETNRDITQRREVESALRDSEERLRLAIDAGQVGTWDWDIGRNHVTWSKHIYEFHGLKPGEFDGSVESFARLVHPDDRERVSAAIMRSVETGEPYTIEMRVVRPSGEVRWIFTNGQAHFDAAKKPVRMVGATVDITDRKRAEEQLERVVAERTAKLRETVGELEAFSYSVSHDLRAPLRVMHGYAETLIEDASARLNDQEREYLNRISRGAQRLDRLINDVLSYSRLAREEVRLSPVDLDRLVNEVIQQYPALQPDHATIRVRAPLGVALGHDAMVTQAFSNLLTNGAKFVRPEVRPIIEVRSEIRGDWLRIWVEDNGIGIARHNLARVFGIFQRLNPESEYEGMGMGLSIVRKAIERLGGSVGVESDEGRGSRFWFELKRATHA